jgi:hypothetical protein
MPPEAGAGITPLWRHYMHDRLDTLLGSLGVREGRFFEEPEEPQDSTEIHTPANVHRVGILDLGEGHTREALIGGLGESHIALPGGGRLQESVTVARNLVMQMLDSQLPGSVKLAVYNAYLTSDFADFSQLGSLLYRQVPPDSVGAYIDELSTRYDRLAQFGRSVGSLTEPWQISLLVDNGSIRDTHIEKLRTMIDASTDYGSIITIGVDELLGQPRPRLHNGWGGLENCRPGTVLYDAAPPADGIRDRCRQIGLEASLGITSPELGEIVNGEMWTRSSRNGLSVPFGKLQPDGAVYMIGIDDDRVHTLLTGSTGQGKSNVLHTLISSLAYNFSPEELEIHLLDYKKGLEFARYGQNGFLPHVKLIGERIDDADPEFGVAALRNLIDEMERRSKRLSELSSTEGNANSYADLHDDTAGNWPRILMIIDEFQILMNSQLGDEAMSLLTRIAQQGRSFGIHLILASQSMDSIDTVMRRSNELHTNLAQRIATRGGTMLVQANIAAESLPRHHVVVNPFHGNPAANQTVWMPDASSPDRGRAAVAAMQRHVHERYSALLAQRGLPLVRPRVFNSGKQPKLAETTAFRELDTVFISPSILIGDEITVTERSAALRLSDDHGRNLAVIGGPSRRHEVVNVMHSAAVSIAKQTVPGEAHFSFVCLDTKTSAALNHTVHTLAGLGHHTKNGNVTVVRPGEAPGYFARTADELPASSDNPHYIIVYGADAQPDIMEKPSVIEYEHKIDDGVEIKVTDGEKVYSPGKVLASSKDTSVKASAEGVVRIRDGGKVVVVEQTGKSGRSKLLKILEDGPAKGVHTIFSTSSPNRLKELLTPPSSHLAMTEFVGAWATIGVQLNQMNPFTPDQYESGPRSGQDRRGRAQFYDREKSRPPQTIVTYNDVPESATDEESR